jgi:hypothetical protein
MIILIILYYENNDKPHNTNIVLFCTILVYYTYTVFYIKTCFVYLHPTPHHTLPQYTYIVLYTLKSITFSKLLFNCILTGFSKIFFYLIFIFFNTSKYGNLIKNKFIKFINS